MSLHDTKRYALGVAKHTTSEWFTFCSEVAVHVSYTNGPQIGGPGIEVEIDETKVGKRKYHKGKKVEGQ